MVGHADVGVVLGPLEDLERAPRVPARRGAARAATNEAATATRTRARWPPGRRPRRRTGSRPPARLPPCRTRPASICAFARRTVKRSSSTGASASRASTAACSKSAIAASRAPLIAYARPSVSTSPGSTRACRLAQLERLLEPARLPLRTARSETQSDRGRRAQPAGRDRPAPGARGRGARPRRSHRAGVRPPHRSAPTAGRLRLDAGREPLARDVQAKRELVDHLERRNARPPRGGRCRRRCSRGRRAAAARGRRAHGTPSGALRLPSASRCGWSMSEACLTY